MPNVCYIPKKFTPAHQKIIDQANAITQEYTAQGLVLTLRQLYYQFVARDLLANKQTEYNRLGEILNDARLAGEMDWEAMIDRTRNRVQRNHWENPGKVLESAASSYHVDLWKGQGVRPIVFVEKDAAIGVVEGVCHDNDVPYFSCRGYTSSSELWSAAQRIRWDIENGDQVVILHIGDHDPSGLDMTRDIEERIGRFLWKDWLLTQGREGLGIKGAITVGNIKAHMREHMARSRETLGVDRPVPGQPFVVKRIALNYNQIEQYAPPPNPAKTTDARFQRYLNETGLDESWELDALDPNVMISLIQRELDALRDDEVWADAHDRMERERLVLNKISKHFTPVVDFLKGLS